MLKVVLVRVASSVPVLLLVAIGAFAMVHLAPGSPAEIILGESATPERVAEVNASLGYDDPLTVQFLRWSSDAVHGDLGTSVYSSRSVTDQILERLPVTLALATGGLIVTVLLGVLAGCISATRPGSRVDRLTGGFTMVALAIPSFYIGLVILLVFAVELGWLPVAGYRPLSVDAKAWALALVLPVLSLGIHSMAAIAKQTRTALLEVLDKPYVTAARARGIHSWRVLWRHAWPNAAPPVLAVIGLQFAAMVGGAVVTEQIFSLPGLGSLAVTATLRRDLPVVQGVVIASAIIVMITNLLVDVVTVVINPRLRMS